MRSKLYLTLTARLGNEVMGNADRHMPRQGQHFALIFETIKYTETDKSCQGVFMLNLSAVKYLPVTRPCAQGHSQAHNIWVQNIDKQN